MKKVLLSLSMLAAVMSASAQTSQTVGVGINDDFTAVNDIGTATGGIFFFADNVWSQFYPNFQDSTTVAPKHLLRRNGSELVVHVNKAADYVLGVDQTDDNAKYSPFGVNFGDGNGAAPGGVPFVIDISAQKTLSIKVKAYQTTKFRIQLEDAAGHKIEATKNAAGAPNPYTQWEYSVGPTYQTINIDLSAGTYLDYDAVTCPVGAPCLVQNFDFTKVKQVLFFVDAGKAGTNKGAGSEDTDHDYVGDGFQPSTFNGVFTIDDLKVGTTTNIGLGTTSAAANIASSTVYPNPTSGDVKVNLTLQTPAKVTMIVTDMVGKQIATQNFGTVSSLNEAVVFDAATLAKGMYTVTYVLDGTPAKTELVVVK